jgi:hypothetical protein
VLRVALSSHGERVAFATDDLAVQGRSVETGEAIGRPLKIGWDIGPLRFTDDGRYLVVQSLVGTWLADLSSPLNLVRQIPGEAVVAPPRAFSIFRDQNPRGNIMGPLLGSWDVETGLVIGTPISLTGSDPIATAGICLIGVDGLEYVLENQDRQHHG